MTKKDKADILLQLATVKVALRYHVGDDDVQAILNQRHEVLTNGVTRAELNDACSVHGFKSFSNGYLSKYRISHGRYDLAKMITDLGYSMDDLFNKTRSNAEHAESPAPSDSSTDTVVVRNVVTALPSESEKDANLVPSVMKSFVRTPNYRMIEKVLKSRKFFPIMITGPSGNGKSLSVIQAAARLKRELIRINVTASSDEDDLIGSFRLLNGETVWQDGPVIEAMKRGAVCLIDEIDMLNPNRAASLFTALEGNPVYIKKTNTVVHPADGFTIISSANTKGKGSDDGRFMGTNILNEAFLERFPITIEFDYPNKTQELKILENMFNDLDMPEPEHEHFRVALIEWASAIRKSFIEGAADELISTRRLVHITKAYAIFRNKKKAIQLAIARFDDETKDSFWELYTKIDATLDENDLNVTDSDEDM
jgi:MoxR-like ATPase